jgi:four helix bundle protein
MMNDRLAVAFCIMHPFRKLKVWREAHELTLRTYRVTKGLSHAEYPGLRGQICRAAQSVPSNISEGSGWESGTQFAHYLEIALSSARELDYLILLAHDLGAISLSEHTRLVARIELVCAMAVNLRKKVLQKRPQRSGDSKTRSLPSPVSRPRSVVTPPSD